jgi:hypothetical protein
VEILLAAQLGAGGRGEPGETKMALRLFGRLRPLLASIVLIGGLLALVPGAAVAGNTRVLYFGSPPANLANCDPATGFCPLTFTGVSAPGHAAADVVVANLGGQTLNHTIVRGGISADNQAKNPNFPFPVGASVPGTLSVFAVFVDPANPSISCPVSGNSFTCDVATLFARQSVAFRLVVTVPSGASTANVWLMASLDEGSEIGKNQDSFYAVGPLVVGTATCTTNQNYFVPQENVSLQTPAGCAQPTKIQGPNTVRGSFASVGTNAALNWCPAGFTCQGILSVGNVNNGQSGPVTWTIGFNFNPSGVIHFRDGYDPTTNPTAYDFIPFKNTSQCGNPKATVNCWISVSPPVNGIRTAVFQTATNGGGRGV